MSEIVLAYVGGGAYLPGVPACDLTQAMLDECGRTRDELLASGLYRLPAKKETK